MQGDVGARLLAVAIGRFVRVDHHDLDGACGREQRQGIGNRPPGLLAGVPGDHDTLAVLPPTSSRSARPASARRWPAEGAGQPALRESVGRRLTGDRQIRVERIENDAAIAVGVPDQPELGLDLVAHDDIGELPGDLDDGALLCGAVTFEHCADPAFASHESVARPIVRIAWHDVDADQVSRIASRQPGSDPQRCMPAGDGSTKTTISLYAMRALPNQNIGLPTGRGRL